VRAQLRVRDAGRRDYEKQWDEKPERTAIKPSRQVQQENHRSRTGNERTENRNNLAELRFSPS